MSERTRLPTFEQFVKGLSDVERARFARAAGTTQAYLQQIYLGYRRVHPTRAPRYIEAARVIRPGARLRLKDIRPDIWGGH